MLLTAQHMNTRDFHDCQWMLETDKNTSDVVAKCPRRGVVIEGANWSVRQRLVVESIRTGVHTCSLKFSDLVQVVLWLILQLFPSRWRNCFRSSVPFCYILSRYLYGIYVQRCSGFKFLSKSCVPSFMIVDKAAVAWTVLHLHARSSSCWREKCQRYKMFVGHGRCGPKRETYSTYDI